jgi:hypothetical protein
VVVADFSHAIECEVVVGTTGHWVAKGITGETTGSNSDYDPVAQWPVALFGRRFPMEGVHGRPYMRGNRRHQCGRVSGLVEGPWQRPGCRVAIHELINKATTAGYPNADSPELGWRDARQQRLGLRRRPRVAAQD